MDATPIENPKRSAHAHSEGGKGHPPRAAYWAEADLLVADELPTAMRRRGRRSGMRAGDVRGECSRGGSHTPPDLRRQGRLVSPFADGRQPRQRHSRPLPPGRGAPRALQALPPAHGSCRRPNEPRWLQAVSASVRRSPRHRSLRARAHARGGRVFTRLSPGQGRRALTCASARRNPGCATDPSRCSPCRRRS